MAIMNKCLVTKLSGVVNDNTLIRLSTLTGNLSAKESTKANKLYISATADGSVNVKVKENGVVIQDSNVSANNTISLSCDKVDTNYSIEASPKYNISSIAATSVLTARIEELCHCVNLSKIETSYSKSTGNIEDLSSLLKLAVLNVKGCNELTGEILNLLLQMCNRGRTEGSLQISASETAKLSFKGQSVANTFYVTFNSNGCVVATNQEGIDVVATLTNGKWSFN